VLSRERRARSLEAAPRVPLRRRAAEEPVREDPAPSAPNREDRPMTYDGFGVEIAGGIATVTLDVPGKLNRISMDARDQLARVFDELGGDEAVRAIVLTGAGETFTAGGDIGMFLERTPQQLSRLAWNVAAPERCPKPVIAALHGYVFGVGLRAALPCDFPPAAARPHLR